MCPQRAWVRTGKVTLIASVWLFSEKMHSHIGCICLILWHCQVFPSGWSHLHTSNQSHNFQDFAPLPMFVIFCPNGCFKLSQIYHWLLVSNNYNCFVFHGILSLFHYWKENVDMSWWEKIHVENVLQKLPYRTNAIHFLTLGIFLYGNFSWDQVTSVLLITTSNF